MKGDYNRYKITVSHLVWRRIQKANPEFIENGFDYWTVRKVLGYFGQLIDREVLKNTYGFKLPYGFGYVVIIGTKIKRRLKNRRAKIEHIKTDNTYYTLMWVKGDRTIYKFGWFLFYSCRLFRDKLIDTIKKDDFLHWLKFEYAKKTSKEVERLLNSKGYNK